MAKTWRRHWGRYPEKSPLSSPAPETQTLAQAQVCCSSLGLVVNDYTKSKFGPLILWANCLACVCPRCGARLVQRCEKEDPGELLYPGAVCTYSLLPQQWAKSTNTVTLTHTHFIQVWFCRGGLSAWPSLLWFAAGNRVSTPRPWKDAPSGTEIIPFSLGGLCMATKPLCGNPW